MTKHIDYTAAPLLEVENLRLSMPLPVGELSILNGLSYKVWQGETLAIVGESGSGKSISTLTLMGLQPKRAKVTADKLRFNGNDMLALSPKALNKLRGNEIAMIFQDPMTSLNPLLTIGEQLIEGFIFHGKGTKAQAVERAIYLLERVGIQNAKARLGQYPHQLSGGLRQRIVIAIALMCSPKLIIADEPTTALDVTVQALILSLLKELQAEFNMALILISHDLGVVSTVSDRVAIIYPGTLMEMGAIDEVIHEPLHPYTRGLLDCIPRMGEHKGPLKTIPGVVPSLIGKANGCRFYSRCNVRVDACASGTIALEQTSSGRVFRCIHPEPVLQGMSQ